MDFAKINFCYLVGYPHLKLASALSVRTTTPAALKEIGINNTDSSLSLCLSLIHKKNLIGDI